MININTVCTFVGKCVHFWSYLCVTTLIICVEYNEVSLQERYVCCFIRQYLLSLRTVFGIKIK